MTKFAKMAGALTGVTATAALVEYQPGAVVSRTIVKKPGGTVTAFAFDAGEELSEHTASFDALVLALDGTCDIAIAGAPHQIAAGQLLLLPARIPHALKATSPFKMLLVMIKDDTPAA
jgi:quercetin dioxygenase-like cupin family protein